MGRNGGVGASPSLGHLPLGEVFISSCDHHAQLHWPGQGVSLHQKDRQPVSRIGMPSGVLSAPCLGKPRAPTYIPESHADGVKCQPGSISAWPEYDGPGTRLGACPAIGRARARHDIPPPRRDPGELLIAAGDM